MASEKKTTTRKKNGNGKLRLGDEHYSGPMFDELFQAEYIVEPTPGGPPGARTLHRDDAGYPARFREAFLDRIGFDIRGTDEDIRNAYEVAHFMVLALVGGWDPGGSLTLRRLVDVVREKGGVQFQRRVVLNRVAAAVERWKGGADHNETAEWLRMQLYIYKLEIHKADLAIFRRELSRSDKRAPARIAAAIAVALGLWGDANEEKSRKAFLVAESDAG